MQKPVIKCLFRSLEAIDDCFIAHVTLAENHPIRPWLTAGEELRTSCVETFDAKNGRIITLNSIYEFDASDTFPKRFRREELAKTADEAREALVKLAEIIP